MTQFHSLSSNDLFSPLRTKQYNNTSSKVSLKLKLKNIQIYFRFRFGVVKSIESRVQKSKVKNSCFVEGNF